MEELELYAYDTIDTVVKRLLEAKDEGKHIYCNFNGVKLYSDSVTLDSAYIEIYGFTKEERDERLKKDIEKNKKRMEEDRKHAIENIPNLIEKGTQLIYPFRHEEWAKLVEADANGNYCGLITTSAIRIMTAIEEEKTIEELVEMFKEQGHSGLSASLTRNIIMTYSKNGYPFYEATKYGEWTIEECEAILKILQDNEEYNKALCITNSEDESIKKLLQNKKD